MNVVLDSPPAVLLALNLYVRKNQSHDGAAIRLQISREIVIVWKGKEVCCLAHAVALAGTGTSNLSFNESDSVCSKMLN